MGLASSRSETHSPDSFVKGSAEVLTHNEIVLTGQVIAQYAPLGRITASGKLIESKSSAGDGSEVPVAIAVHAIDTAAPAGDASQPVYKGGGFDETMVSWDASWTAVQKLGAFDRTPIVLITPV